MQWDETENAGFSKAAPWLPVPPTAKTHNVADESNDPESVLAFYKKVLKLRHTNKALLDGSLRSRSMRTIRTCCRTCVCTKIRWCW